MKSSILNIVLQVTMATGLLMVVYLLFMPVLTGLFAKRVMAENRSVLEINESRNGVLRMVVARAKKMLAQNPNAHIEIVASGSGINLLVQNSSQKQAVQSLITQGVVFTACQNSIQRLAANASSPVELLPGVRLAQDGHRYAEQLKDNGYVDELA